MRFLYLISALLCLWSAAAHEDDVHTVQYTVDNYAEEVAKKNHFVMFYAPWCGHCKRLAPTWEQLAEMLNEDDGNIRIAKVDCTTDSKICSDQDVTGYPTLKFFRVGEAEGVKFRGTRDLPSLTTFINEQLREGDEDDAEIVGSAGQPLNGLIDLTEENFDSHVAKGKHFVKFYAPWCGHCQNLAPTWEALAKTVESDQGLTIAKIDCTQSRDVCNRFEVKGYPTLLWIEDGKKVEKYQGQRTHDDLKAFADRMMGSAAAAPDSIDSVQEEKPKAADELTGDNFASGIKKGLTFVKFFAPWCGHCKRLAPTWEELGRKFGDDGAVKIVKIDCTLEVNKELCSNQEVEGFPTVFLYQDGKKISEYEGSRTLEDLHDFVMKYLPAHDEL